MKGPSKSIGIAAALILGCLLLLLVIPAWTIHWRFSRIEQNARKAISGDDLQAWAMRIVAQHPSPTNGYTGLRISELSPPLPSPLLGLYRSSPTVFVYETTSNRPGHVRIIWGCGTIGHCGFEIGSTNFVGKGNPWQDGVYFWRDDDAP